MFTYNSDTKQLVRYKHLNKLLLPNRKILKSRNFKYSFPI